MTFLHVLSVVFLSVAYGPNPNPWLEVNRNEDVVVWAREVPNSNVREIKAEGVIAAPAVRVWDVLGDVEHFHEFMPYVVESKVVAADSKNGHFEYTRLDPPLVNKRDYTLSITTEIDPNGDAYIRTWTAANHQGPPPRSDSVRLDVVDGSWTLERIDATHTRATYMLLTDPGGSIPAWMANRANTTSIPDLLDAVRRRALDPNWRR